MPTPNRSATSHTGQPRSTTCATASRLNSSVNLFADISSSLLLKLPSKVSTNLGATYSKQSAPLRNGFSQCRLLLFSGCQDSKSQRGNFLGGVGQNNTTQCGIVEIDNVLFFVLVKTRSKVLARFLHDLTWQKSKVPLSFFADASGRRNRSTATFN